MTNPPIRDTLRQLFGAGPVKPLHGYIQPMHCGDAAVVILAPGGTLHWLWIVAPTDQHDRTTYVALRNRLVLARSLDLALRNQATWFLVQVTGKTCRRENSYPAGVVLPTTSAWVTKHLAARIAALQTLGWDNQLLSVTDTTN